jgi:hypothetical protein
MDYQGLYGGRVRSDDPTTSWHVARIDDRALSALQATILDLLEWPRTDDELIDAYLAGGHPPRTPNRIRTARAELVSLALVRDTGKTAPSRYGNPSTVWTVTS